MYSSGKKLWFCFQGEAFIDISIMDDTEVESAERFGVTLMRVIGGARLGVEISVTVTIPPNDSPLGSFGFQEKTVSHNSLSPNKFPYREWKKLYFPIQYNFIVNHYYAK